MSLNFWKRKYIYESLLNFHHFDKFIFKDAITDGQHSSQVKKDYNNKANQNVKQV